jgi:putative Mg2+ transporter-C (MgtC) family protein
MTLDIDLAIRLVVAAVLGAGIGVEREVHGHPAGMRTHLLVSLGSALFTILSIHGFVGLTGTPDQAPVDPSRVAAQVVSGIGFLGAGAILKDGFTIRGLTTAASLWATAAIGMAAGAGQLSLAVVGMLIVLVSLWPLNLVADRLHGLVREKVAIRVVVDSPTSLEGITAFLDANRVPLTSVSTEQVRNGLAAELHLDARRPDILRLTTSLAQLRGVLEVDTGQQE